MIKISSVGKYLDQPILTAKLNKQIPAILTASSAVFTINEVRKAKPENRKKTALKTSIILGATVLSASNASKIASYITKRPVKKLAHIVEENTKNVSEILEDTTISKDLRPILKKAKDKILSLKEVDTLNKNLSKKTLNKLIPDPENITSKDIFKEIGWLSIFGIVPVIGGIAGGIAADKLTEKNWKSRVSNKIKEGLYQYLANIFMCNIGAGLALGALEKMKIRSKSARCVGMVSGILLTGVIGGSAIANFIGNKFINPVILKTKKEDHRTPELLDLGLHTDDIATVSLLSGLKWIEPSLPLLYAVSGYRAGIGYRNDHKHKHNHAVESQHQHSHHEKQAHFLRTEC